MTDEAETAANMIEQLRKRGIRDERVLRAIRDVPRSLFVGQREAKSAYDDTALPIGCGQTISQPFIVAYMTEKLGVEVGHDVLEIGTGSGYQAAVLSSLCRHVYTIERHPQLLDEAKERFRALGLHNVTAVTGDGTQGWPEPHEFDRIIVTAATSKLPQSLIDQLKDGGRIILPIGSHFFGQSLMLIEKTPRGLREQELLPVRFVPLVS